MKMLIGLLALAMSFATLASSGETKTFVYDGSQNSVELMLRGEKTHTEYRYEQYRTTCTRTEVDYRTICYGGGYRPGPDGRPIPVPRQCRTEPHYRTVYYPCTQTRSIPYEVKDYDVDARVIVDVTNLSPEASANENISVSLMGESLSINVGSKKFFAMMKKQDVRSSMNGGVKFLDGLYAIELIEAAPVLKALSMTKISISNDVLKFNIGPVTSTDFLGFSLFIEKKKTFGSDETIFNRELNLSEVVISPSNTGSEAGVDVSKLGLNLSGGKFGITAKTFFKASGTLLNKGQFNEELEASRTLIYTNR